MKPKDEERIQNAIRIPNVTVAMASVYQSVAIVAALAESGALDPIKVADWAERLATPPGEAGKEIHAAFTAQLKTFAQVIRGQRWPYAAK